jgi:hypothetical protein
MDIFFLILNFGCTQRFWRNLMAKSCLDYRSDRLQKAKQKQLFMDIKERCIHGNLMIQVKKLHLPGFDWDFEQHITADVSIALELLCVYTR